MTNQSALAMFKSLFDNWCGLVWFGAAIWGGTAGYVGKVKRLGKPFSLVELIGEWAISGFSGVITGLLCVSYGVDAYVTTAIAGVSGHMGSRTIYLLESLGRKYIEARLGIKAQALDE
jgi:hypothetical protein